jgi:medium-chain acyl-CoA synthetase
MPCSLTGWAKAAWSFFGAWNCGASLFIHDDRRPFNVHQLINNLHRYPISTMCAPPTAWRQLVLEESKDYLRQKPPKALTHCTGAGEPLNSDVIKQWQRVTGLEICDGYGQTETILICGNFDGSPIRPGSMGKPSPNVPLTVINAYGQEAYTGEEGDIALHISGADRPDSFFGIFDGYINDDGSLTRRERKFTYEEVQKQTWYLTGDRAFRDSEGYFWFVGRSDDVINSSGYRIGPFEVESTLKQHPAVVESAVVSSPDTSRGEVVKAFIVLTQQYRQRDEEMLKKDLQDFCKKNAAPYKYPRKIQFVPADFLPKTISGKIRRNELKKMEWSKQENEGNPKRKSKL